MSLLRKPSEEASARRLLPRATYLLILFVAAVIAATVAYGASLAKRTSETFLPLIEASYNIRTEASQAHLWAEEFMAGDAGVTVDIVWKHLDRAAQNAQLVLTEYDSKEAGVSDPALRVLLDRTIARIEEYRGIAARRLAVKTGARAGTVSDRQFDAAFAVLLKAADEMHERVHRIISGTMGTFRVVQICLISASFLLSLLVGFIIYRFDRRRHADFLIIQDQNLLLQASNQQLQATEQQLRASNQQLRAGEQQLRAMNQQLQASEQQLRATNQQLQASEQALRESEQRYRSLFANMTEGVALHRIVHDDAGTPVNYMITEVNPQYESILGLSRDRVVNKLATEAYGTSDPPYLGEYSRVAMTGEPHRFETYFPPLDRHFQISATSPERGVFATIFSDITQQKNAEASLRQNELRLQTLLEVSHYKARDEQNLLDFALENAVELSRSRIGYIYHYDERTQTFTLNSWSGEAMKECAVAERSTVYHLPQTGVWGDAVRERRPIILNNFSMNRRWEKVCPVEHVQIRKFMTIPIVRNDRIVAVTGVANKETDYNEDDVHQLTLLMDSVWQIIELRREREERGRLEVQMQKLESVGLLAGGIAHDFNNLLTAILANVTFARMQTRPGETLATRLEEIEKAALRARDLTQQLLTFARGGKPVRKLTRLEPLLRDAATLAVRGSSSQCEFRMADDLCGAQIDEGQISQAVSNLVLNAIHAMPGGGKVTLEAENIVFGPETEVPIEAGRYVRISVSDQGVGISSEHLDRVFDPYFTTKQKGSGLGLSVTYSIVKNHEGHITVDSIVGKGTTFHVYLRATCEEVAETPSEKLVDLKGSGSVLIMDDEEIIRNVASAILRELGFEVTLARDGGEAVEQYSKRMATGRPFDVVILDLTVPGGMGGKEALERILAVDPGAKAIVSSGYSTDPVMADYRRFGFRGLVAKPYTITVLSQAMKEVLASCDGDVSR